MVLQPAQSDADGEAIARELRDDDGPFVFNSKTLAWAWLSNVSAHAVVMDGVAYPTVEHAYQAAKFPVGIAVRADVLGAPTPASAKALADASRSHVMAGWDDVKVATMWSALVAKFTQHPELRDKLLATRNRALNHFFSDSDVFWGQRADGTGENRLGLMLMRLRCELSTDSSALCMSHAALR